MVLGMTVVANLVQPPCGLMERDAHVIWSVPNFFPVSIDIHSSYHMIPGYCHVGPRVRGKIGTP